LFVAVAAFFRGAGSPLSKMAFFLYFSSLAFCIHSRCFFSYSCCRSFEVIGALAVFMTGFSVCDSVGWLALSDAL